MAGFDYRTNDANGVLTTGAKIMAIFGSHAAGAVSSDLAFRVNNAGTIGEAMRITAAGNVGIGTTSPYAPLSVNGQIVGAYFTATTTATSTFGGNLAINGTGTTTSTGGFNISAGCFAVNGTCLGGSSYGDANVNSYVNGSSTIAKLYTANTWNALQTFGNNISLGGAQLSMGSLSSGNLMSYNGTNWVNVATSSLNLSIPLASTTGTLGVGNGGTGATSFGQGWIYSNGGTGALSASTSPTVAYVMATSTTATSTLPLLSVTTALSLTGKLYDSLNSAGSNGYVLQSTGSGTQWVATSSLGLSLNSTPNIQIFSTTGANTWTKPAGASVVEVVIYGGGGQGGGGDGNAAGTTRIGGSGGGGGAQNMRTFNAADLGSSETVTIGAGGTTGGTGGTNGVGTAGQGGGVTTFGSYISAYGGGGGGGGLGSCTGAIFGGGGGGRGSAGLVGAAGTSISNGGSPGVANTATALGGEGGTGSNGNAEYGGGGGGAGSCTAVAGGNGGSSLFGGPGGGGGGGIKVDNTTSLGGPGGAPNSYVAGTGAAHNASGTAGSSSSAGSGAGGGDSNGSGTGTAGGAGGNVGAGGGGGGGGTTTGGAGGAGGNGYAVVITWTTSGSSQWSASGNNISYSAGNVGIGTTTPGNADLFGVAGNVYIGGAGTSTVQNNLDVLGTFHSKLSYTGDLFFANNFSFTEAPLDGTPQGLLLKNQNGSRILSIDENGNLSVPGDICAGSATSTLGSQCLGQSLQAFSSRLDALASSTAEFDIASTTYTGIASTTIDISTQVAAIDLKVDALASSTVTFADLASSTASIASTTAAKLASSTPFIQTIANAVVALLQSSGQVISSAATWTVNEIHATLAVFTDVKTNTIETQTAAVSNGLEMTDSATGAVYCVKITNGDFAKVPGSCVAEATSTPAVNNQLPITNYQIQNSTTAVFATTTMPLISTTTITSTTMPIISTTTPIMVAPMSTGTTTPVISADPSVSTPPVPPIVPPVATSTSTVEPVIPSAPVDESATPVTPIQTPTTAPTGGGQ
jgi:hypothetical protein